jgi:phosphomannomutase
VEKVAGESGFFRLNLKLSTSPKIVMEKLKEESPERLAGQKVSKISEADGLKFFFVSGDWFNICAAGTEELLRLNYWYRITNYLN